MSTERAHLSSGVPGLDIVLGGGIPAGNMLFVTGQPGAGKTVFTFQLAFHAARAGHNVLYVSTLSEPVPRLLSHIQGFSFWDEALIGDRLFVETLVPLVNERVEKVVKGILGAVAARRATLLLIDGFTTFRDAHPSRAEISAFLTGIGDALFASGCTTVLTNAMPNPKEAPDLPELTMCDGVLELFQQDLGARTARRLRAWKMRGRPNLLGTHSLHLDANGLSVFPRLESVPRSEERPVTAAGGALSTGLAELDAMTSGGLPVGSSTILAGARGTGKTLLALQSVIAELVQGLPAVLVTFRENADAILALAERMGLPLEPHLHAGRLTITHHLPVELDADAVAEAMLALLDRVGARLLVIDSLVELEQAVMDRSRQGEFLTALGDSLRRRGVTTLATWETSQAVGPELDFSGAPVGVLAENLLLLRHVEYGGQLRRIASVLKMRQRGHDTSIREYRIQSRGLEFLRREESSEALLRGVSSLHSEQRVKRPGADVPPGSVEEES